MFFSAFLLSALLAAQPNAQTQVLTPMAFRPLNRQSQSPQAFVANYGSGSVSVIDTTTNLVVASLLTGTQPIDVIANPTQRRVYVVNYASSDVSVIDTTTDTILGTIATGPNPYSIAVDPTGDTAYVAQISGSEHIYVLDLVSNTVKSIIPLPPNDIVSGIAFDPTRHRAYVTDNYHDTLLVFNTDTQRIVKTVTLGNVINDPLGIMVGPLGLRIYIGELYSEAVLILDASSLVVDATIPMPGHPERLRYDPYSGNIWAPEDLGRPKSGNVVLISRQHQVIKRIFRTGPSPFDVGFAQEGKLAYLPIEQAASVDVIDTTTGNLVGVIPVGSFPFAIAIQ